MRAHILRRLLISIPLVFLMTFLVFAVINLNPEASIQRYVMQPNVSFQFIEQEKERLGLYDPLPLRYLRWLGGVLGDVRFGRETRAVLSFADAGALRTTFELQPVWPMPFPEGPRDAASEPVDLLAPLGAGDAARHAAAQLAAIRGEVYNAGPEAAQIVLGAAATVAARGDAPDAEGAASGRTVDRWETVIEIAPGASAPFVLRAPDLAARGTAMGDLAELTLAVRRGGPVEIRSVTATTGYEVVRPSRGRPYLAMPFLGAGHTYAFQRLGSPYTRLVLPRTDWAPRGKVIAVEDIGGEPTEVVETRAFRALRLDIGNPLPERQDVELLVVSGPPEDPHTVAVPFSVGPVRRELRDVPLAELQRLGVDIEAVHGLGLRATGPGGLVLARTLLVVDERPFRIGWVPNFGTSYENNLPVLRRLGGRVRNTILLVIASMLLTWAVALPFGVIAAVRQYSATDKMLSFVSFIGMALPGFFLAVLARYVASLAGDPDSFFSFLPALPTSGRVSVDHETLSWLGRRFDILRHAILPILVLGMGGMAGMQRIMRGTMLEVLRQPFITTARAKGLRERTVIYKHALRNAITPFVAGFGSILPALIGGSALIEIVFNYPGVGQLMLPAVLNRDINLVMGNTLIAALLLVVGNLIADILLVLVDPRVSYD